MECGRAVWREQADVEWEGSSEKNGWYVKVHSKDTSKIVKKKLKRIKKKGPPFSRERSQNKI